MSVSIPTLEPLSPRAGDTWRWVRTFPDYPAPGWVLTYTLFSAAAVLSFSAAADGTDHLVDLPPATTAAYPAGRYDWVAHVSNGTDRHQVGASAMTVQPDLAEAATYDGRSHARKMLDSINAMLEGRATSGDLDTIRIAHGQRAVEYSLEQLLKLRQQYAAAVAAEEAALALARGDSAGRMIQVRFVE